MFPTLEVRHLNAVIALAESMNYTRAAERLHITQSGFSKQIAEIEDQLGFSLFVREGKKVTDLTDAGRIFVEHARLSVLHNQRAVQLARVAHEGAERFLHIGHSPYADRSWIAALLAIRLPLYPRLKVRLSSDFVPELMGSILTSALDLALITAPPADEQITAVEVSRWPLYAAVPERHPAARKRQLRLKDLADEPWVMFQQRVNPVVHHAIMRLAEHEAIHPKQIHEVLAPQEAIDSVAEDLGVAFVPKPAALRYHASGVSIQPLWDQSLWFDTCLVMRGDNDSRMTNEFARAFLKKFRSTQAAPVQLDLPIAG
jgi:DNA-binding transcriptional LysR family regulator